MEGIERIDTIRRNTELHVAYDLLMKAFNKQLMKGDITTEQYTEKKTDLDVKLKASIVNVNG